MKAIVTEDGVFEGVDFRVLDFGLSEH